jgi:hypothetical protein
MSAWKSSIYNAAAPSARRAALIPRQPGWKVCLILIGKCNESETKQNITLKLTAFGNLNVDVTLV